MPITVVRRLLPLLVAVPHVLHAQEAAAEAPPGLLSPNPGLMIWTLVIFLCLFFILAKFAYPKILGAVEAREQMLEEAIANAKKDRDAAATLLAEHRRQLEGARDEAQRLIADARVAGEQVRTELIERAHKEQQELIERARQEITAERDRAIAVLRKETVELAIQSASKVIEKNLDDADNRRLVESFLASIPAGTRAV